MLLVEVVMVARATEEAFFTKVQEDENGCWTWMGGKFDNGYGAFRNQRAHRWCYEFMVGEIPAGLQLDHLCKNKACVKPDHLEPVTASVNTKRRDAGPTCRNGHPRTGEETKEGWNRCRRCQVAATLRHRAKNREAYNAYMREYQRSRA